MMAEHPLFAVNQFTTLLQGFDEDLALYHKLGVGGIELCEQKLPDDPEQAAVHFNRVHESGVALTSVQPKVHALFPDRLAPEPQEPEARAARFRQTIDRIAEHFPGANVPLVTITGAAPDHDFRKGYETARRIYPELADYAGEKGLRVAFEPVHPILMNQDTFIYRLEEALGLIEEVGRPNFGLVLDVFHLWPDRGLLERIPKIVDRIFIVHVGDWPRGGPRAFNDRVIPGQGVIDLPGIFGTLEEAGYQGAYVLELLSSQKLPDSLWKADPQQVVLDGRRGFEAAWEQWMQVARA